MVSPFLLCVHFAILIFLDCKWACSNSLDLQGCSLILYCCHQYSCALFETVSETVMKRGKRFLHLAEMFKISFITPVVNCHSMVFYNGTVAWVIKQVALNTRVLRTKEKLTSAVL